MNYIKINNVSLDDFIINEDGKTGWTQVCNKHLKKFPKTMRDEGVGHGVCGVYGCICEADHYIDFKVGD